VVGACRRLLIPSISHPRSHIQSPPSPPLTLSCQPIAAWWMLYRPFPSAYCWPSQNPPANARWPSARQHGPTRCPRCPHPLSPRGCSTSSRPCPRTATSHRRSPPGHRHFCPGAVGALAVSSAAGLCPPADEGQVTASLGDAGAGGRSPGGGQVRCFVPFPLPGPSVAHVLHCLVPVCC